jgi:hypothetical protein
VGLIFSSFVQKGRFKKGSRQGVGVGVGSGAEHPVLFVVLMLLFCSLYRALLPSSIIVQLLIGLSSMLLLVPLIAYTF